MNPSRNVLIALDLNEESGRRQLAGILRFLESSRHWNIQLMQHIGETSADAVRNMSFERFDGLISGINAGDSDASIRRVFASCRQPTVFMDAEPQSRHAGKCTSHAFVHIDNREVGLMAARHLMSLGNFSSFGFVPEKKMPRWSQVRGKTFATELKRNGKTCSFFTGTAAEDASYRKELNGWLTSLPKPAALFCAWDPCAVQTIAACRDCAIPIPEQAVVLGVDDDEFLCNLASPSLSSIRPDFESEGFLAAKTLDTLMGKRKSYKFPHSASCRVVGITERDSTRHMPPSGFLVRRALAYIEKNACRGISVADVVSYLGVSRSLLTLRFRQIQGNGPLHAIRRKQMDKVRHLLRTTGFPVARITAMCGFKSENNPKAIFRDMFGQTMSEYRKLQKTAVPYNQE
jgi:LacI family transcriptional regulator